MHHLSLIWKVAHCISDEWFATALVYTTLPLARQIAAEQFNALSPPFLSSCLCVCVPTPSSPKRGVGLCGQAVDWQVTLLGLTVRVSVCMYVPLGFLPVHLFCYSFSPPTKTDQCVGKSSPSWTHLVLKRLCQFEKRTFGGRLIFIGGKKQGRVWH